MQQAEHCKSSFILFLQQPYKVGSLGTTFLKMENGCVQLMCTREPGLNQYCRIGLGVRPGMLALRRVVYNTLFHNFGDRILSYFFHHGSFFLYDFNNYFKCY